jgi:hypothetical protein
MRKQFSKRASDFGTMLRLACGRSFLQPVDKVFPMVAVAAAKAG